MHIAEWMLLTCNHPDVEIVPTVAENLLLQLSKNASVIPPDFKSRIFATLAGKSCIPSTRGLKKVSPCCKVDTFWFFC
jgi:hypothetical protein